MLSKELFGLVLILLSAMLYSVFGCFLKLASETGIPSMELLLIRTSFQVLIVLPAMCFWNARTSEEGGEIVLKMPRPLLWTPLGGSGAVIRVVVATGLVGGLCFITYFYTIVALPLGDAIALFSLHPIFAVFLATTFLSEPIRLTHLLATVASVLGAVLISRPTFIFGYTYEESEPQSVSSWLGYWSAVIGSFFAGAVFVLIRKAGNVGAHTLQLLLSWSAFGSLFSVFFGCMLPNRIDGLWCMPPSGVAWCYILGMCVLATAALFLMNYAGRIAPAGLGSIVRSSNIMWAYLWEIVIFHKVPNPVTCAGVLLICFSVVAIAIQKMREEQNQTEETVEHNKTVLFKTELNKNEAKCIPIDYGSITNEHR